MKKVFVAIVALFCSVTSFAQYSSGGFSLDEENLYWGVRFGITGASLSGDSVVGLRASDSTPVFIESGLYYTERGGKEDKFSVGYNNLEVPIIVKYGIKATDEIAVLPFIGPYFSYAISGKAKVDVNGVSTSVGTFDEKKWSALKRANMGFKLGCGAEYNKMYLELGYQFGVANISKDEMNAIHGNAWFINIGVNLY